MGKKRQLDDGGGEYIAPKGLGSSGPQGGFGRSRGGGGGGGGGGGLDIDEVPRPKKTKPQNLQKLSFEELNQRKHDLKMEENYHSNVMGIKKRGPYSASDVRASYTQVLRFQYLQKEVDLEIERREARKESQQEAKARKKQEKEEAQRAAKAALAAAQEDSFAYGPGVALPPGVPAGGDVMSGEAFTSWNDMTKSDRPYASGPYGGTSASSSSRRPARSSPEREEGMNFFQQMTMANAGMQGMGSMNSMGSMSSSIGDAEPKNPMASMAMMMLETQKKLKEAQEKMNKVSEKTSGGSGGFQMGQMGPMGCGGCGSGGCSGCGGCGGNFQSFGSLPAAWSARR